VGFSGCLTESFSWTRKVGRVGLLLTASRDSILTGLHNTCHHKTSERFFSSVLSRLSSSTFQIFASASRSCQIHSSALVSSRAYLHHLHFSSNSLHSQTLLRRVRLPATPTTVHSRDTDLISSAAKTFGNLQLAPSLSRCLVFRFLTPRTATWPWPGSALMSNPR
jgi:hypothetical protein